jgi:DNA-binding FadR family transcriptional regulator
MVASKRDEGRLREKPQQIADELRAMIVSGTLSEGDSLGREPELVERFGVSRPSLREALRILEAENLITVVRGAHGGVIVHEPDERMTARTVSLVLRARNVSLADVFEARSLLEPLAARAIASDRNRRAAVAELRGLIDREEDSIEDPERFAVANAAFHEQLVSLGETRRWPSSRRCSTRSWSARSRRRAKQATSWGRCRRGDAGCVPSGGSWS